MQIHESIEITGTAEQCRKAALIYNGFNVKYENSLYRMPLKSILPTRKVLRVFRYNKKVSDVALGSALGLILAVLVTYLVFKSSIKFKDYIQVLGLILIYIGAEMFAEGILKLTELCKEPFEVLLMMLYAIPSLYIFLKNDVKKLLRKA